MNCTILEFADVVEAVQNQNLNATEYVATCDEACLVMFGSGDPDISGPGVMIGYICQVTLTCIFGPLLPVLFWLIRFRMSNFITLLKRFLLKLRSTVYNINAFYAVSIIVAILVRIKQTPSILEVYFMSELMDLQISILLSLTVATVCDRIMNDAKFKNARVLYHAAICIASIFLSYKVALPKSAFPVYYEVALACHEIYQIKDVSGRFQLENVDDSAFKTTWIIIGASGGAGAVISSIGVLLAKYATRIYENVEKIVRIFIPVRLRRLVSKYGWTLWSISIVLLWLPYLVLITIPLFETQYLIKQLNGDKLNDNEWSYGQTTAVLLWMPFTWKLFIETISMSNLRVS
ncbi:hypothetical protein CC78DRAFT_564807 [Lojkania enalia]|uniref:Uncharacterized protein n=1 Tax=Lojkania enalia TaxID=147567 RepID=A0A9P4NAD3_9PLEO|nr:hypothetical protein CC78DRAFT_564807 [Didymosphaeria enalia]